MFGNLTEKDVMALARRVGRVVARDYPGVCAEDIASEAMTRLLKTDVQKENPSKDYIRRILERHGRAYAAKERYDYIIGTSQYVYTPKEVRALLEEAYFDLDTWDVPTERDDYLSAEIGPGTVFASLIDVDQAMDNITDEHRYTLEKKFLLGEAVHPQRVSRAVNALTRAMNRIVAKHGSPNGGPGSRKAISNDRAQNITRSAMNDDRSYQEDALDLIQREYRLGKNYPPGTFYNWDKYNN